MSPITTPDFLQEPNTPDKIAVLNSHVLGALQRNEDLFENMNPWGMSVLSSRLSDVLVGLANDPTTRMIDNEELGGTLSRLVTRQLDKIAWEWRERGCRCTDVTLVTVAVLRAISVAARKIREGEK